MRWIYTFGVFLVTFILIGTLVNVSSTTTTYSRSTAPEIKTNAPVLIKMNEDSPPLFLDLFDIFVDSGVSLNFSIRSGGDWVLIFQSDNMTVKVLENNTLEIKTKQDMNGKDLILINATNQAEQSTYHQLTINIEPVNDRPVIETLGNLNVKNVDFVKIFGEQDEWLNLTVTASDADGDKLVYLDNCSLFDIGYADGIISYKPTNKDVGYVYFNLTVSDINGSNSEDWINVELTILNINDPPTAKIIYPLNGSEVDSESFIRFEGESDDPDIGFGDRLKYEWSSDLDGLFGDDEEAYAYYLSEGTHEITFKVTDFKGAVAVDTITIFVKDPYNRDFDEIELKIENNILILYPNEIGVCRLNITNNGTSLSNVTIETESYFDFEGKIDIENENKEIGSSESCYVNVTITVPSDAKPGFYPVNVAVLPENYFDPFDYYFGTIPVETIKIIVVSGDADVQNKQLDKPSWDPGYQWTYEIDINANEFSFSEITGEIKFKVNEEAIKNINGKAHEVYVVEEEGELSMKVEDDIGLFTSNIEIETSGFYYYEKSNLADVMYEGNSDMTYDYFGEETRIKMDTETVYDPPMDEFDFPVEVGESWTAESHVDSRTEIVWLDEFEDTDTEDEEYDVIRSYICIGTEQVTTDAGTFDTFVIIKYDEKTVTTDDYYVDGNYGGSSMTGIVTDDFGIYYYAYEVGEYVKLVSISHQENFGFDFDNEWKDLYEWVEDGEINLVSYSKNFTDEKPDPDKKDKDLDNDGMPDEWEDYFDVSEPSADDDNDGYTNKEEFDKGTDPTNKFDTPEDPIDLDKDDIPDSWESYYGLNPFSKKDADEDEDGDGYTNREEYNSHTSPTDPTDFPGAGTGGESPDENGAFGLGKLGGVDLAYVYIAVVFSIIIILVMITIVLRRRKGKRGEPNQMGSAAGDQRVVPGTFPVSGPAQAPRGQPAQVPQPVGPVNGPQPPPYGPGHPHQGSQAPGPGPGQGRPYPVQSSHSTQTQEYNPAPTNQYYYPTPPPVQPAYQQQSTQAPYQNHPHQQQPGDYQRYRNTY